MPDGLYFTPSEQAIFEILERILVELAGIRLAVVHMATQDKSAVPDDFDLTSPINESVDIQQLS